MTASISCEAFKKTESPKMREKIQQTKNQTQTDKVSYWADVQWS